MSEPTVFFPSPIDRTSLGSPSVGPFSLSSSDEEISASKHSSLLEEILSEGQISFEGSEELASHRPKKTLCEEVIFIDLSEENPSNEEGDREGVWNALKQSAGEERPKLLPYSSENKFFSSEIPSKLMKGFLFVNRRWGDHPQDVVRSLIQNAYEDFQKRLACFWSVFIELLRIAKYRIKHHPGESISDICIEKHVMNMQILTGDIEAFIEKVQLSYPEHLPVYRAPLEKCLDTQKLLLNNTYHALANLHAHSPWMDGLTKEQCLERLIFRKNLRSNPKVLRIGKEGQSVEERSKIIVDEMDMMYRSRDVYMMNIVYAHPTIIRMYVDEKIKKSPVDMKLLCEWTRYPCYRSYFLIALLKQGLHNEVRELISRHQLFTFLCASSMIEILLLSEEDLFEYLLKQKAYQQFSYYDHDGRRGKIPVNFWHLFFERVLSILGQQTSEAEDFRIHHRLCRLLHWFEIDFPNAAAALTDHNLIASCYRTFRTIEARILASRSGAGI